MMANVWLCLGLVSGLDLSDRGVKNKAVTPRAATQFFALTIGINDYADAKLNLAYATPDAKLIHSALAYPDTQAVNLSDGKATRAAILDNLDTLMRRAHSGDFFVLYLAGHGVLLYNDFYFLPHEATLATQFSAGIAASTLINALSTLVRRGVSVLVVFDACQSGAVGFDISKFYADAATAGIGLFFAASPLEPALEASNLGHGVFTYYMAEALKGAANRDQNGVVSLREFVDYTQAKVKSYTEDRQNPVYIGTLANDASVVAATAREPKATR